MNLFGDEVEPMALSFNKDYAQKYEVRKRGEELSLRTLKIAVSANSRGQSRKNTPMLTRISS
jgi:hypothetical protein